uniref:Uncharacterized protein n=1 Tax=Meloidogyne enterolobii TaxID=390850 RepID=A0A6V7VSY9_MELEN|nr:unnamed protein product [Meloidogyne enterolobii]
MLTILSDNENLLERLELMTQNMPKPQNTDKTINSPIKARSRLLGQINTNLINNDFVSTQIMSETEENKKEGKFEICRNWMILMGKRSFEESQAAIQSFSDLFRFSLAMVERFIFE